jgi:uncharacterized DUF497 family protein
MLLACHSRAALGPLKGEAHGTPSLTARFIVATIKCAHRFRPRQRRCQFSKHGVSLAAAAELNWDAALAWIDDRVDYGEIRIVALAPIGDRLFVVAFVDRRHARRIISLRKANRREVNHYVSAIQEDRGQDAVI